MPKIAYIQRNFKDTTLETIDRANEIIEDYAAQGFMLTLRQLYYQFVSRDWLANTQRNYKNLGGIINDGRLAGLIDWSAIEDRTRNLESNPHWKSPADIMRGAANSYALDLWAGQEFMPEVWIEKEALAGVIERPCEDLDVPFFACRGYTSQSEMWNAAQRLHGYKHKHGRTPVIIHLGDHGPSGIDMTRDIRDRLEMFFLPTGFDPPEIHRIALNMDQVKKYDPPPNPAKTTDSRFEGYMDKFGHDSWELDALDPATLVELVRKTILIYRDEDIYNEEYDKQERGRDRLNFVAGNWGDMMKIMDEAESASGETEGDDG